MATLDHVDQIQPNSSLFCRLLQFLPTGRKVFSVALMNFRYAVPVEQISAPSSYLTIFQPAQSRQCLKSKLFFLFRETEKNPRYGVMHHDLIKELFSKRCLAAAGRADEQIEAGANAIQSPAEIGKTGFPAGNLSNLLLPLQVI